MDDPKGSSGKRQFELFLSSTDIDRHFGFDDFDSDDDFRGGLQCPYCLEELCDVPALCDHLECEHPYESKGRRQYAYTGASSSGASSSGASSSSGWPSSSWRQNAPSHRNAQHNNQGQTLSPAEQELKSIVALLGVNSGASGALSDDDDFPVLAMLQGSTGGEAESSQTGSQRSAPSSSRTPSTPVPAGQQTAADSAAAEEHNRALQEEAELQVQFVQELLLSTMGL